MLNFLQLFDLLKKHSSFIITTHVNPDPDAIGSEIAMTEILKQMNKKFKVINRSETPYNIRFLDYENVIEVFDEKIHSEIFNTYDAAILLDLNHLNRTSKMEPMFREFKGEFICIDHHTNPEKFSENLFIDESKSSTGELIFDFINSTENIKINYECAVAIYSAIMTDTGSFRFSKTNPDVHRKTAELLEFGLSSENIYDKIYSQFKFSRNKMLGYALSSIKITDSGRTSYMVITQKMLKDTNGIEADVDGFVNFALNTKDVQIGILFFELRNGIKISFRSKGLIPINFLARQFGGGGHLNAAGTRLYDVDLNSMIPKVIDAAEKLLLDQNIK